MDYYQILEIEKNATNAQIKKSYYKMASIWHPDKHPNENKKHAEEKFKLIAEAYEVLSDEVKRKKYDNFGKDGINIDTDHNDIDPFEMFSSFFKSQNINMTHTHNREIPNFVCNINLSFEQMYNGCIIKKNIMRSTLCETCCGSGCKNKTDVLDCISCNGHGYTVKTTRTNFGSHFTQQEICSTCTGSKINPKIKLCDTCNGEKLCAEDKILSVNIPKGIHEGQQIVIKNEGHALFPKDAKKLGFDRSNVIFIVKEEPHDLFKRLFLPEKNQIDYSDLMINLNITFGESILGFNKIINHLNPKNNLNLNITTPCRHDDALVFKGMGMPQFENPTKFGDLIIFLRVEHPNKYDFTKHEKSSLSEIFKTPIPNQKTKQTQFMSFDEYKISAKIKTESSNAKNQSQQKRYNNSTTHTFNGPINTTCNQQ